MTYDALIVGGGLSGLMAGISLRKKRKNVLILEQHSAVGGHAAGFTRQGYYFDSGVISVGLPFVQGFFEELGLLEKLDFRQHGSAFSFGGFQFSPRTVKEFFEDIADCFPEEKAGILAFHRAFAADFELCAAMNRIPMPYAYSGLAKIGKFMEYGRKMPKNALKAMARLRAQKAADALARHLDPTGRAWEFFANWGYRGLDMFYFIQTWVSLIEMENYPAGGFQALSDALRDKFLALGGELKLSMPVHRLLVEKGRCRGVLAGRAHAEEEIQARNVITAIDLKKVFLGLLEDKEVDSGFRATLEMQEMSETYIPLYLGLRLAPATLRRRLGGSKHLYYSPAMKQPGRDPRDSEYFKDIGVGLFSSCLINPAHAPAGSSNLLALVTAPPAGWQDNWGLRDGRKTEVYAGLKHRVTGQLLEVLGTLIPELADPAAIEVCELGTPHTIERYTGNTGGSSCGFCWDLDRTFVKGAMPGKYFDRYKAIKGLHLAGHQTSYGGGIPNALLTGKSIAAKIRYRGGGRGRSAHPGRRSAPAGLGRTAPPRRASLRGRRPLRAIPAFPGGGMDHLPR